MIMARRLMCPPMPTLLALIVVTTWICTLPPCSADATVSTATTTAAAIRDNQPIEAAASPAPAGSTVAVPAASIAASPATSTASKKLTLPIPADFGFGGGYGGQSVPGGGLGGFNGYEGGFGGCCGGFGYNGFGGNGGLGYDNGPLFFGSASARRLRLRSMVAAGNGFAPLLMAGAAAMFYM